MSFSAIQTRASSVEKCVYRTCILRRVERQGTELCSSKASVFHDHVVFKVYPYSIIRARESDDMNHSENGYALLPEVALA